MTADTFALMVTIMGSVAAGTWVLRSQLAKLEVAVKGLEGRVYKLEMEARKRARRS